MLCSGWRGRTTLALQATIWVYGAGTVELRLRAAVPAGVRLSEEGRVLDEERFVATATLRATLTGESWHALVLDGSRVGLRLDRLSF